jgi:hypothetical protein
VEPVVDRKVRPPGLKPAPILETLRGAEAPLFHGIARICFFAVGEAAFDSAGYRSVKRCATQNQVQPAL